jgi:prepilin-type processing-associated H-X9-DG protein
MDSRTDFQQIDSEVINIKTSRLAIASFVMSLLSMTIILFLLGIPAIICGIVSLIRIKKNDGKLKGTGLAVSGIAISTIFAILLAIFMPALGKVGPIAQRVVCGTNLKALATGMYVYVYDYEGMLPTEAWCDLLIEEADNSPRSFVCQDSGAIEGESSYGMNKFIAGMKLDDLPSNIVLFFETDMGLENGPRNTSIEDRRFTRHEFMEGYYDKDALVYKNRFNQFGGPEDLLVRHKGGCNIAFADGHVEFITEDRIDDLKWTME